MSLANLQGADLSDSDLQSARAWEVNLQGATLTGANLQRAQLRLAHLAHADLSSAKLQGADLLGANLQQAILTSAKLEGVQWSGVKLQGAKLGKSELAEAYFDFTELQGADFSNANLQCAQFKEAKLQGADLSTASLQSADFISADLTGANLSGSWLYGARFFQAKLRGADLRGARLYGTDVSDADLEAADLRRALLWRTPFPRAPFGSAVRVMNVQNIRLVQTAVPAGLLLEDQNRTGYYGISGLHVRDCVERHLADLLHDETKEIIWAKTTDYQSWERLSKVSGPRPAEFAAQLAKVACREEADAYVSGGIARRAIREKDSEVEAARLASAMLSANCKGAESLDAETRAKLRKLSKGELSRQH